MRSLLIVALTLLSSGWLGQSPESPGALRYKKLIASGWDNPTPAQFRRDLAQMEKQPLDGVIFEVPGQGEGAPSQPFRTAFENRPWKREWFRQSIDDLKACKPERLTENFLGFHANPGNVDWFDDEGWRRVVDHWRIAAWVARQTGVKGIVFDAEAYTKPFEQFHYASQPEYDRHGFEESRVKARERGRAVMQAVAKEYPGITILTYFLGSGLQVAIGQHDPQRVLETHQYGLLPAFLDGWLDVLPPTVTIVDGDEFAYLYNSEAEFNEAVATLKCPAQELVSPENRAKYRAQVQVGFGIYLDAYRNPSTSQYYIDGRGAPRIDRLRANLASALRVADKYVWIRGEQARWWPASKREDAPPTWPEALPGCDQILAFARDPQGAARAEIAARRKEQALEDLVRNGDFTDAGEIVRAESTGGGAEGRVPAEWSTWQEEDSHGSLDWDGTIGALQHGAARAANVRNGCFVQTYRVEPGQRYAVQAKCRERGRGGAWIRVRWQRPNGQWTAENRDVLIPRPDTGAEWSEMFEVVLVPEGVGQLVLLLGARDQASPSDAAWFDDVHVYRVR